MRHSIGDSLPPASALFPPVGLLVFLLIFYGHYWYGGLLSTDGELIMRTDAMAEEFRLRSLWLLASAWLAIVALHSLVVSGSLIWKNWLQRLPVYRRRLYGAGLFVPGGIIFVLVLQPQLFSLEQWSVSGNVGSAFYAIGRTVTTAETRTIVNITSGLCLVAMFYVAIASTSIMARTLGISLEDIGELRQQNYRYRTHLYVTGFLLCSGILQIFLLHDWLAVTADLAFVPRDGTDVLARGLTEGSAILYTIIFVILFLPPYLLLNATAQRLAEASILGVSAGDFDQKSTSEVESFTKADTGTGNDSDSSEPTPSSKTAPREEIDNWLKDHGFFRSPTAVVTNYSVLLSPMILGALEQLIQNL